MPPNESLDDVMREAHALADQLDDPEHELTDDDRQKTDELLARAKVAAEHQRQSKADNERRDNLERLFIGDGDHADGNGNGKRLPVKPDEVLPPGKTPDTTDLYLASKSYAQFKELAGMSDSVRIGTLPPVQVPGILGKAAPVTSGGLGGLAPVADRLAMPAFPWGPPLTLLDVITRGTTGSDTVEYAQLESQTSNAAPVAEASDITGTSGLKPQSVLQFTKVTVAVRTIAHWLAATKRALADAGQLRTLIDSFLRWGLEAEVADQILNGDGTGENFLGLFNVPGTLAVAAAASPIETIRKGITAVEFTGLSTPNAVAMNPADAEGLDLAADSTGRFFGNGPFGTGPTTIWGLPRVVDVHIPAGTAVVGDFRQAVLWDRQASTITASDSHADFFVRNLVAILAELRAAFGVFRPQAFAICTLAGGGGA